MMKKKTKQQYDFIKMVAGSLARIFVEPLFELCKERNYAAHIGGLAEILDWAQEFHDLYYDKVLNWEIFESSSDNIYHAISLEALIVCFGKDKLKNFYAQNLDHPAYFLEKYSALRSESYLQL